MSLKLHYRGGTNIPVEIEGFLPETVAEMSPAEIERFEIFHGNRREPLAEFFDVSGDPAAGRIDFEGDLRGVHWIGAGMSRGEIHVHGPAGRHLGSEMTGGAITVEGDAGDWVGAEMHGGTIRVAGRAGHLVGAAYRGSRRGMTGGNIFIGGDAGNELGHTMRRGLIVIGGGCGDLVGFNMIAGNVYVFGAAGIRHGAGMRRGTLGFFHPEPPPLLPTFRHAARFEPQFLKLLFRQLRQQGVESPSELADARFELYHGDFLEGGRGEIMLRAEGS